MTEANSIDSEHPLLPLGGGVLLAPPMARTFGIGRPGSLSAVRSVRPGGHLVFSSLRDPEGEMTGAAAVFRVGVRAIMVERTTISPEVERIFVEALERVTLEQFSTVNGGFHRVSVRPWPDRPSADADMQTLYRHALERFAAFRRDVGLPPVTDRLVAAGAPAGEFRGAQALPWVALSYLGQDTPAHWVSLEQRQALLEAPSLSDRLRLFADLLDDATPPATLADDMTPFILRAAEAAHLAYGGCAIPVATDWSRG